MKQLEENALFSVHRCDLFVFMPRWKVVAAILVVLQIISSSAFELDWRMSQIRARAFSGRRNLKSSCELS
jgi:hypothetical protein